MSALADLRTLAELHGIEPGFHDVAGRWVEATVEALVGTLGALGVPAATPGEAAAALAGRRAELADRLIGPVEVAWDGKVPPLPLRLRQGESRLTCRLALESGDSREWAVAADELAWDEHGARRLTLPPIPPGYHTLYLATGQRGGECLLIGAPLGAYQGDGQPQWGLFLPLYALRTASSWGAGDFSDLATFGRWVKQRGGGLVATLPLLAAFLDQPFEPSPYAPASRLFWNEFYIDPRGLREAADPEVKALLDGEELGAAIAALRSERYVDYGRLMALKRRLFEAMTAAVYAHPGGPRAELESYVATHPELARYAAFRAVGDRRGEPWQSWPAPLRNGTLGEAEYDPDDHRYHLWVQWAAARQIDAVAAEARRDGAGLYLDLPLGVHASGYDVWRHQELFALDAAAGAPPDTFFTKGQNWGFPPMHPEQARESGYRHLRACLRHHLEHAGVLRIDHVMQLHRLFWIPRGQRAAEGAYVRYPAEELYAILALESHRHRALIVGENLGTVPPEVNAAMTRHGLLGMYVLQYELAPGGGGVQRPAPRDTVASLNTHDMPSFRAFWEGRDIGDLEALGFFDAGQGGAARERRQTERGALAAVLPPQPVSGDPGETVMRARLVDLARSRARIVLISLEDLWGEEEPQNVPGTSDERPNWRRKARFTLEDIAGLPALEELLAQIAAERRAVQ